LTQAELLVAGAARPSGLGVEVLEGRGFNPAELTRKEIPGL
jgi:hypothetical protein